MSNIKGVCRGFEGSQLGLQMAAFSLCLHLVFLTCGCVLTSSSYKDTSHSGLGPI